MGAVGWAANPYLALIDPSQRYKGPSPEFRYPQPQPTQPQPVPQQTGTATTTGFDTLTASPYQPNPTDQGVGGKGIQGSAEYGPMTGRELGNMWGGTLANKAIGLGFNALMGQAPTLGSFYGMAPKAAVTLASVLSSLFGGLRGVDAEYGVPSVADIQSARDLQGNFAGDEAAAQREAGLANAQAAEGILGQQGFAGSRGNQPGGWGTETQAPTPGVTNPDMNTQEPGWGSNERSFGGGDSNGPGNDGGPSGGPGSGESSGMGSGTTGEAKGGVHRTKRGFSRLSQYGEAGPEEAIFVPQKGSRFDMTKPGIQGNERSVKKALSSNLSKLRG